MSEAALKATLVLVVEGKKGGACRADNHTMCCATMISVPIEADKANLRRCFENNYVAASSHTHSFGFLVIISRRHK